MTDKRLKMGETDRPPEGVSEQREHSQELPFLAALPTRFRTLALLAFLGVGCDNGPELPEVENMDTAGEERLGPQTLISVDDPRTSEQLHLDLVEKHEVLKNNRQPILMSTDYYAKQLSKAEKKLEEKRTSFEKQKKKRRPKKEKEAKKYDEELKRLQKSIADYEKEIAGLKSTLEQIEPLHRDRAWVAFLEKTNYRELVQVGAILPTDLLEDANYLNVEGLWPLKMKRVSGKQKTICETVQANLPKRVKERMSYEVLYERISTVVETLRPHAKTLKFRSPYLEYIDADTLLSIGIQEIMPSEYNSLAKIHLMRVLLDEGFEPEFVPAIFDSAASFGFYQATAKTHGDMKEDSFFQNGKVLHEGYRDNIEAIEGLPRELSTIPRFEEADDLDEQTLVVYLLSLENHENLYNNILKKDEHFSEYFERSSEMERHIFFSGLAGYLHNHGFSAKSLIPIFNNPNNPVFNAKTPDATLSDAYERFVANSGGKSDKAAIASRHAKGTGDLVSYVVAYGMVDHPFYVREQEGGAQVAVAKSSQPTVPSATEQVRPALGITRTTLLPKKVKGTSSYVFTVPNWQLDRMMGALLSDPSTLEKVRAHNGGGKIAPGKNIYVPANLMKPELQAGQLLRIEVKNAQDAEALLKRILKPEYQNTATYDTVFVLSNGQNWKTWDDVDTAIRVPEAWVNLGNLTDLPQAEPQAQTLSEAPRVAIFTSYQPLLDRAAKDGFAFSTNVADNKRIYDAAKAAGVPVPMEGEGYRVKPYEGLDATLYADALAIVQRFAAEFKARSGGYSLSIMDLMRSPEQQDAVSISKGTHPGGRTADIADGRFIDPAGNEITWSEKGRRGPHADEIENKLRPIMIQLLEEYQARGFMMAFDETEKGAIARGKTKSGGHWHVYIPTRAQGPVGPLMKP